jgi:hypothetical protein
MEELDDLKAIWKNNEGIQPKKEAEIASMLKGSSKTIIGKLKRNVWIEITFTLVAGLALLLYALTLENGSLKWTSISILVLFVGYSFYYVKKLLLLSRFDSGNADIKSNLEKLIANLKSYLKFYKRSYTVLYPVYFCLGLLFAALERGAEEFLRIISRPNNIIYLLVSASLFFVFSRWLTNWYLKKLYGDHLEKLKALLTDIEMAEPTK